MVVQREISSQAKIPWRSTREPSKGNRRGNESPRGAKCAEATQKERGVISRTHVEAVAAAKSMRIAVAGGRGESPVYVLLRVMELESSD